MTKAKEQQNSSKPNALAVVVLGALGVVYGDIGTSPLYAFRVCFSGFGLEATEDHVLGVLSLILWSLIFLISIKYLLLVLRADLRGEGGVLALMTLAMRGGGRGGPGVVVLGLLGAGLLYGDSMLTPAVSVLSAVEGLEVAAPELERFVVPAAIAILVVVFTMQRHGTARIGRAYGPVMLIWFLSIAALGIYWIVGDSRVLVAANPAYGLRFLADGGFAGFQVLGGVFLVLTGGEALYADMGHFGRRPIRLGWFTLVLPALLLNYFGQGALMLRSASEASHPFFEMAPRWGLYPLIVLASAATVVASQAVISGAFSLTYQAGRLGYLPHFNSVHYAAERRGQVYIPSVNWMLFVATVFLVIGFRSSGRLAGAYGVAVSGAMVITSLLIFLYVRRALRWNIVVATILSGAFLTVDLLFLGANLTRFLEGGWVPIMVGVGVFVLMSTWRRGRELLRQRRRAHLINADEFLEGLAKEPPFRAPGTAVFISKDATGIPATLIDNLNRNHVLHERVVLLTLVTKELPRIPQSERLEITQLPLRATRIIGNYGFMQTPNIPALLNEAKKLGEDIDLDDATYFIDRDTLVITPAKGMAVWRKRLFRFLTLSARDPTQRFQIPADRVIEIGDQIKL